MKDIPALPRDSISYQPVILVRQRFEKKIKNIKKAVKSKRRNIQDWGPVNVPECFIYMGDVRACQDGLRTSFEQPSAHSGLSWWSVRSLIITFCMIEVVQLVQIKRGTVECRESDTRPQIYTQAGASDSECLVNSNITGWSSRPLLDGNQI